MKIRIGFVSNSSSSSFTCDVTGETYSGMDMWLTDFGMVECEHGHIFFESYLDKVTVDPDARKKREQAYIAEQKEYYKDKDWGQDYTDEDWLDDFENIISEAECPLCQFLYMNDKDMVSYLLSMLEKTREEAIEDAKMLFKTYSNFIEFKKG